MVRAKFRVTEKIERENGYYGVVLYPVVGGSEENKEFWKATPGGKIEMFSVNQKAIENFKVGQEFYVDFTPAE